MKFIIAPAKKMNVDTDGPLPVTAPRFLEQTKQLYAMLQGMDYDALKKLWACNDGIAWQNVQRLRDYDPDHIALTPALLAYEGIQYRFMAPRVFTAEQLNYVHRHLRIVSGLYGLLRPCDGVIPYRLEMQAKLSGEGFSSLYDFWGSRLAEALDTEELVNLASKEYSRAVLPHFHGRAVTCVFAERKEGKIIEKGTQCKMARGEMMRYAAETQAQTPQQLKGFDRLGYAFQPELSNEETYVFVKGE